MNSIYRIRMATIFTVLLLLTSLILTDNAAEARVPPPNCGDIEQSWCDAAGCPGGGRECATILCLYEQDYTEYVCLRAFSGGGE